MSRERGSALTPPCSKVIWSTWRRDLRQPTTLEGGRRHGHKKAVNDLANDLHWAKRERNVAKKSRKEVVVD
jgi:hypothetical protein